MSEFDCEICNYWDAEASKNDGGGGWCKVIFGYVWLGYGWVRVLTKAWRNKLKPLTIIALLL